MCSEQDEEVVWTECNFNFTEKWQKHMSVHAGQLN